MHLQSKCRKNIEVLNCASAGRSAKSYEKEGLWKKTGRKYYAGRIRKYNQAILDTASACGYDCVDLCSHAFRKLKVMPNDEVCQMYMATSELPQKKGKDFCHFKGIGAEFYAALFVQLCKRKKLRIGEMFTLE